MRRLSPLALLLGCLLPAAAAAHTYTPIDDASLADRAAVIVRARVLDRSNIARQGTAHTGYRVEVLDRVKGSAPARLTVLIPGGVQPDGSVLLATSSPELEMGEELLLFLDAGPESFHRLVEGRLGAFHIEGRGAAAIASRRLVGPPAVFPDVDGTRWLGPRRVAAFVAWLRGRAAGRDRPANYFVAGDPVQAQVAPFSLLQTQGRAARWPSTEIEFRTTGVMPGEADGGIGVSTAAAAAWDTASGLSLTVIADGGSPSSRVDDGINGILYTDPADEISGSFDCGGGGTLGETRIRIQLTPQEVDGETFFTLIETDVVLQDGIECWLERSPAGAEELIGHEIGHAVGIDHSDVLEALMFRSAHGDGRGARLDEDDVAALRALKYGEPDPDDPGVGPLPGLRKPRALRPRGSRNDLPLELSFRTRDEGSPLGGPVLYYEVEIYARGGDTPIVTRSLRFERDLDPACAASGTVCEVLLDVRPVTSALLPGERYAWRLRARQGFPGQPNDLGPWSNRRKFRIRP